MALFQQAMEAANRAVSSDGLETPAVSAQLYLHASGLLSKLSHMDAGPKSIAYRSKAEEYRNRAATIHVELGLPTTAPRQPHSTVSKHNTAQSGVHFEPLPQPPRAPTTTTTHVQSNRAPPPMKAAKKVGAEGDRLFKRAKSAHNDHNYLIACDLYKQSAAAFLKEMKTATTATKATLQVNAETAINAAEKLHVALGNKLTPTTQSNPRGASPTKTGKASPKPTRVVPSIKPTPTPIPTSTPAPTPTPTPTTTSSGASFTKEEIAVLKFTSTVNSQVYLPWTAEDMRDDFSGSSGDKYTDPAGMLKLSATQRKHFKGWQRPGTLFEHPKMCVQISSKSIRQTVVPNCSFVCSMAVSADYERRFNKPIITNRIFPRRNGVPVVNPAGKYIVKLYFNGCWRKVTIDDYLPSGHGDSLLCSHSNNDGELWVSLIEKAYLRVMGGYDFPGSNSGVDLHALTGWIPERLATKDMSDKDWTRIGHAMGKGDVLLTVATGVLSKADEDRTGLVPTHAYAVLNMREVDGQKLLHIKNPWNKQRWKGKFSPHDAQSWTTTMKTKLNYDVESAKLVDNGEFWIDLNSVKHKFEIFHMNWNPDLFKHTQTIHKVWSQQSGPVKDEYNYGENPQFRLEITSQEKASVWILLSRHITRIDDFANNNEYVTCHVFEGGNRIHYPDKPIWRGTKINSPHALARFEHPGGGTKKYTIVISQHEKSTTLRFTLKAMTTAKFKLIPMPNPFKSVKEEKYNGEWTMRTAGGSTNHPQTHELNPKWTIKVGDTEATGRVLLRIQLFGPRQFATGMTLRATGHSLTSGNYRSGYSMLQEYVTPGVAYTFIPSTFDAGKIGPFFFKVIASERFHVSKLE